MNLSETQWNGFKRLDFCFEGRKAILVLPENPQKNNKWIYKTEYFEAFPTFEIEMLKKGYCVANLSNISRLCPEEDTDIRPRFCDFLSEHFSLSKKCLLVGLSCGGMQAVYFAAKYPEYAAAIYLDAPVLNLLSWPLGLGKSENPSLNEFKENIGLSVSDMLNYRKHPIDCKERLLESNIPIFLVCGDSDKTVPYEENGKLLSEFFKSNNGNLTEILKKDCDHHPHGLKDFTCIFNFIEKYY